LAIRIEIFAKEAAQRGIESPDERVYREHESPDELPRRGVPPDRFGRAELRQEKRIHVGLEHRDETENEEWRAVLEQNLERLAPKRQFSDADGLERPPHANR